MPKPKPMNPEVKKMWLEELPKWKVAKGALVGTGLVVKDGHVEADYVRNLESGRCCLGVLCEIAIREGVITKMPEPPPVGGTSSNVGYYLPDKVARWAGIPRRKRPTESLGDNSVQNQLAALNDGPIYSAIEKDEDLRKPVIDFITKHL